MELLATSRRIFCAVMVFFPMVLFSGAIQRVDPKKGIPQFVMESVSIHQLSEDHPVSAFLNRRYFKFNVSANVDSLKKAGFKFSRPRKHTGLIVAKHADTPGYIYKIYTDAQEYYKSIPESQLWLQRIEGAQKIRDYLNAHDWNHLFKVPQKWIYVIPKGVKRSNELYPKFTILVEEDMGLLPEKENLKMWKGDTVTKELLDKVFSILADIGLRDCAKPDNIPFSYDLRIAFIDTQTFGESSIPFRRLSHYLNKENKKYWNSLYSH